MSGRVAVSPSVLAWAIEESQRELTSIEAQFPKLQQWLSSEAEPTFKQLKSLSDFLYVPFGYMFLDTPPKETELVKEFRTINNRQLKTLSKDLKDTLSHMKFISSWMSELRQEEEDVPLAFVASAQGEPKRFKLEKQFFEVLHLQRGFSLAYSDPNQLFKDLRTRMEQAGALVFRNGKVGNNTRRPLSTEEFRAFSLVDRHAPLIFINSADSITGQVFSLIHEFLHLVIGQTGATLPGKDESVCNKTTAALLMPDDILETFLPVGAITNELIVDLALRFNASAISLAYVLLNRGWITNQQVHQIAEDTKKAIAAKDAKPKGTGGPDFYRAYESNISQQFRQTVAAQLQDGRLSYTAASQLLGLPKSDTVIKVVQRTLL